jgi:mono/diheme cytochrome c family protein
VKADGYACLECHTNIGHVYQLPSTNVGQQTSAKAGGWYSVEQATAGTKLFETSCCTCHGENLQGVSGPALSGVTWQQRFGGAKLLTVWGEIKGPMAEYAGTTFTTQQSLDLLAYLLQQNGVPAGTQPLADTRTLSDTLPDR